MSLITGRLEPDVTLPLFYNGEFQFCRAFALRSELAAGIPDLWIVEGRQASRLRLPRDRPTK